MPTTGNPESDAAILAAVIADVPTKPGYKTTEFLFALVVLAMGFYMMNWGPSVGAKEGGETLMQWALVSYVGARAVVKGAASFKS